MIGEVIVALVLAGAIVGDIIAAFAFWAARGDAIRSRVKYDRANESLRHATDDTLRAQESYLRAIHIDDVPAPAPTTTEAPTDGERPT